jgi:hypothetical protein
MRLAFIKWKIKFLGSTCVQKTLKEAKCHIKECFTEENYPVKLYPVIMTDEEFNELEEFQGW